jgi:hypothetical protein
MKQLQKLIDNEDSNAKVKSPLTIQEMIERRKKDYETISDKEYAKKHSKNLAFKDTQLSIGEEIYSIQSIYVSIHFAVVLDCLNTSMKM